MCMLIAVVEQTQTYAVVVQSLLLRAKWAPREGPSWFIRDVTYASMTD